LGRKQGCFVAAFFPIKGGPVNSTIAKRHFLDALQCSAWSRDENKAEKFFDQRICSPIRDAGLGKNLHRPSLFHARRKNADPRAWGNERPKEIRMQKTILTLLASALIATSTAQVASAAQPHRQHVAHQAPAKTHERWRNSNAYVAPATQPYTPQVFDEALSPPAGH